MTSEKNILPKATSLFLRDLPPLRHLQGFLPFVAKSLPSPRSIRMNVGIGGPHQFTGSISIQTGRQYQGEIYGTVLSRSTTGYPLIPNGLELSPDGTILAIGHRDGAAVLWDFTGASSRFRRQLNLGSEVNSGHALAFRRDGKTFAALNSRNEIVFFDAVTLENTGLSFSDSTLITSFAISPNDEVLAAGEADGTIILWNLSSEKSLGRLKKHEGWINNIVFSPDGSTLVSSGMGENTVILWDINSLEPKTEITNDEFSWMYDLDFSPDGNILAVSDANISSLYLWDVKSETVLEELTGELMGISNIAFSPDGKTLAAGNFSDIILWDMETLQPIGEPLRKHGWVISGLAFSPDGNTLVSSSQEGLTVIWDLETRQAIGELFIRERDWAKEVVFSPNGDILIANYSFSSLILWQMDPTLWIEQACQMAGRNINRIEWTKYLPAEIYPANQKNALCPQWPLE